MRREDGNVTRFVFFYRVYVEREHVWLQVLMNKIFLLNENFVLRVWSFFILLFLFLYLLSNFL